MYVQVCRRTQGGSAAALAALLLRLRWRLLVSALVGPIGVPQLDGPLSGDGPATFRLEFPLTPIGGRRRRFLFRFCHPLQENVPEE